MYLDSLLPRLRNAAASFHDLECTAMYHVDA